MASISSMTSSSNRITGIISGLDTDSLVAQLMKVEKMKVDKVMQSKQLLEWKRDDYRSMTNLLRDFSDQYFNLAKPSTNFRSTSAFAAYKVTSGDASVATATVNASASNTTHSIAVKTLAAAAQIVSSSPVSAAISGSLDISNFSLQGKQISVTLDGTTKVIDLNDYGNIGNLEIGLTTSLNTAFGSGKFSVVATGNKIEIKTNLPGSSFNIAENPNDFISSLGFWDGKQNFITSSSNVDTDFSAYVGGTFNINYGGSNYSIDIDSQPGSIGELTSIVQGRIDTIVGPNQIKVSDDGNKLTFTSITGQPVTLSSGTTNDVLKKLKVASGATTNAISSTAIDFSGNEKGKSFTLNVDGVNTTVTIDQDYSDLDSMAAYIQSQLSGVSVQKDPTSNKLIFSSSDPLQPKNLIFKKDLKDSLASLGFASTDNTSSKVSLTSALADIKSSFGTALNVTDPSVNVSFNINNVTIDLKKDYAHATLNDVMTAVNTSNAGVNLNYNSLTDKFTLTSKTLGAATNISLTDSGAGLLTSMGIAGATQTDGNDAEFTLDGISGMKRNSNAFTIEGVTYTLNGKSADYFNPTTIGVEADVDGLFAKITGFVEKYNDVIGKINTETSQKKNTGFLPLTDEQRAAMKDTDITTWETKAKSGMLQNDRILTSATQNMRSALYDSVYTKAGDSTSKLPYTLSSIGITTGLYLDKGKLIIDENKLKAAIKDSPDRVANLFSQESTVSYSESLDDSSKRKQRYAESGLAQRLYDVLQDNIRTTRSKSGYKGALLEKAGIEGDASEYNNLIYKDIDTADENIDSLNEMYTYKENNYYAKFTRLEQALSQMNSQSSWLSSQLGTGTT